MSEVLLRYLRMVRREGRSRSARLLFPHELEAIPGSERERRSVAIVVSAEAYTRIEHRIASGPASVLKTENFFFSPLNAPAPGPDGSSVIERVEASVEVEECAGCHGAGKIECRACRGQGVVECSVCVGRGWLASWRDTCVQCNGRTRVTCRSCNGDGLTHAACNGEGRIARWEETVAVPFRKTFRDVVIPAELRSQSIRDAVERWLPVGERLTQLSREAVVATLGYDRPDLGDVLRQADAVRSQLGARLQQEGVAETSGMFSYSVIPISACEYRNQRGRRETFWLVGTGGSAVDLSTTNEPSSWEKRFDALMHPRKGESTFLVPGLIYVIVVCFVGSLLVVPLALCAQNPRFLRRALDAVACNLRRLRRAPRTRTMAVAAPGNAASTYLACVASIGSHVGRLKVVDSGIGPHVDALIDGCAGDRGPSSVILQVGRNEFVRLISLSSDGAERPREMALLPEAVDGVVQIGPDDESVAPEALLRARDAAEGSPPSVRALDLIREAFTRQRKLELDWPAVFDKLWAPIQRALNDPMSVRALSEPQTAGPNAAVTAARELPRQIPA